MVLDEVLVDVVVVVVVCRRAGRRRARRPAPFAAARGGAHALARGGAVRRRQARSAAAAHGRRTGGAVRRAELAAEAVQTADLAGGTGGAAMLTNAKTSDRDVESLAAHAALTCHLCARAVSTPIPSCVANGARQTRDRDASVTGAFSCRWTILRKPERPAPQSSSSPPRDVPRRTCRWSAHRRASLHGSYLDRLPLALRVPRESFETSCPTCGGDLRRRGGTPPRAAAAVLLGADRLRRGRRAAAAAARFTTKVRQDDRRRRSFQRRDPAREAPAGMARS